MGESNTSLFVIGALAVVLGLLLLLSTGPEEPASPPTSQTPQASHVSQTVQAPKAAIPPFVDAGNNLTLDGRESARLTGHGYDPGGEKVTYHWTAEGRRGYFDNAYQLRPLYTAPSICNCEECIALTLTVTNDHGVSTSDQMFVLVRGDPITCPPPKTWGPCGPVSRPCEEPCRVRVEIRGPCEPELPPCEVPCVPHIGPLEPCEPVPVPCCTTCRSACGEEWPCPWYPGVTTPCRAGAPPTPIISRRYPSAVNEGGTVQIHGKIRNPACNPVCFSWSADKGWFDDPTSLDPIWHAPMTNRGGGEDACITLVIQDGCGGRGYDQIRLHINNLRH